MPSPLYAYHYGHMSFPLKPNHRYPLPRYARLRQRVLDTGLFYPSRVVAGRRAADDVLLLGHSAEYLHKLAVGDLTSSEERLLNLPWSEFIVERARCIVGATHMAAERALQDGISFVLGGGTHHAHRELASGFCLLNDVACAALALLDAQHVARLAVFDCDVHQGDGTATMLAGNEAAFTCSIHASANFPFTKAQSDLDIGLPTGSTDADYLSAVDDGFAAVLASNPDVIFYVAGVDPFVEDRLGKLSVSAEALTHRDQSIMQQCRTLGIPLVVTLGGGYTKPISTTVGLNLQTIITGVTTWQ